VGLAVVGGGLGSGVASVLPAVPGLVGGGGGRPSQPANQPKATPAALSRTVRRVSTGLIFLRGGGSRMGLTRNAAPNQLCLPRYAGKVTGAETRKRADFPQGTTAVLLIPEDL
jgi:hypothetical protein